MIVIKFGGSSIATPERIRNMLRIVRHRQPTDVAFVFSAFGGVTDQLITTTRLAVQADAGWQGQLKQIEQRHLEAVRALLPAQVQNPLLARLKVLLNELEDVLQGVFLVRELTPRSLDYVLSFGERLSCTILTEALREEGWDAHYTDARFLIRTNEQFGAAKVDFEETYKRIRQHAAQGGTSVVTGFIGSTPHGDTTTLGRSGSDYTAAILAGALRAEALEIWTDVDGVMTADPRKVPEAFSIPELSYEEAMELSHFGAKVLFPATMQPAMAEGIPILIKNTFRPEAEGSRIHRTPAASTQAIKGISSMDGLAILNVQGSGLLGVVGMSGRLFHALAKAQVNVVLISQASSEHSICLVVDAVLGEAARQALAREFVYEIQQGWMNPIEVEPELAIVAVVGEGMRANPGTSGRLFHALGRSGINVRAIAQGSSELNISVVIAQREVIKALRVLHESFFLSDRKTLTVYMAGTGLIGSALLRMIEAQSDTLRNTHALHIQVAGLINSRRMIIQPDERGSLSVDSIGQEPETARMDAFVQQMKDDYRPNRIFVDCTASEAITAWYPKLLEANISIVTPNKKANAASLDQYRAIRQAATRRGVRFLYETNVGAGLPVINTLHDLLLSGDRVLRLEAVLSGTLNFLFSAFEEGTRFSDIVKLAVQKGYTEPDPRDDLNGMDVARKLLILARECGAGLELHDIETQSLLPASLDPSLSVPDFLERLAGHDEEFDGQRAAAAIQGKKLRYMATFAEGRGRVGLEAVAPDHPFYSLAGSDNILILTTERYRERPMVIRGPGAGAEVTAAGVFADIIRIGNYA